MATSTIFTSRTLTVRDARKSEVNRISVKQPENAGQNYPRSEIWVPKRLYLGQKSSGCSNFVQNQCFVSRSRLVALCLIFWTVFSIPNSRFAVFFCCVLFRGLTVCRYLTGSCGDPWPSSTHSPPENWHCLSQF